MKSVLGEVFYIGYGWRTVACSGLLTLIIILYVPVSASLFHVDIYFLVNRITYHTLFEHNSSFNLDFSTVMLSILFSLWITLSMGTKKSIIGSAVLGLAALSSYGLGYNFLLQLIALSSVPVVGTLVFISYISKFNLNIWIKQRLVVNYLAITLACLAFTSIYFSIFENNDISPSNIIDPFLVLYSILSHFSPLVMFLCVFSVFVIPLLRFILYHVGRIDLPHLDFDLPWLGRNPIRYVLLFMAISVVLISIPHFNASRTEDHPNVSVDIVYYEKWISELQTSSSTTDFLSKLFVTISGGDRPITLLLMLLIVNIVQENITEVLELIMPAILAPTLILVVYLLTRELTSNIHVALLCSFLTLFSFQVLAGTYGGYYANWLGLVVMYLSLLSLMKYLRNPQNHLMLIFYAATALLLMFVHVYSLTILFVFTLVFIIVSYIKQLISKRTMAVICLIVLSLLAFDMVRNTLGYGRGIIGSDIFTLDRTGSGIEQIEIRWSNLVRTVQVYVGGIYGNIFLLSAALLGSVLLYRDRQYAGYFVLIFFSLGILPLFFGEREIIARFLYDIPFQIPAAVSLFWLYRHGPVGSLVTISIVVSIIAASIRIVTNF